MNGKTHAQGQTPFPEAWWAFDLGRYRSSKNSTYFRYEYGDLPKITDINSLESLDWLGPLDKNADPPDRETAIATAARSHNLKLPDSFDTLMSSPKLQDRIRSCTGCYFTLPDRFVPCPTSESGLIARFYNDQQDVLRWYLYLTPARDEYVLVTTKELETTPPPPLSDEDYLHVRRNTWVCAHSFTEFVYRWYIENSIWFKVSGFDKDKLTDAERAYLKHYEPNGQ